MPTDRRKANRGGMDRQLAQSPGWSLSTQNSVCQSFLFLAKVGLSRLSRGKTLPSERKKVIRRRMRH